MARSSHYIRHEQINKIHFKPIMSQIYLDLLLVLILVWFLNRQFEIGYRLTFYGNAVANKDKIRVQNMKNQADMLLHNIIPKHVAEHLKNTAKYSENHHNVAIIFCSIVNFHQLYDETYYNSKVFQNDLAKIGFALHLFSGFGSAVERLLENPILCIESANYCAF